MPEKRTQKNVFVIFQQNNRYSSLFSSFPAWSQTCFTTSKIRSETSDIWIRFNDFRLYYSNSSNVHNKIQSSRRGTMVLCFCVCCISIRMKNPHKTKYSILWRHNRYQFNIWNAQIFKSIIFCGFSVFFCHFFPSVYLVEHSQNVIAVDLTERMSELFIQWTLNSVMSFSERKHKYNLHNQDMKNQMTFKQWQQKHPQMLQCVKSYIRHENWENKILERQWRDAQEAQPKRG